MYVGMADILPPEFRRVHRASLYPARVPTDLEQQSSELVVYAARLVRAVRRRVGAPAGIRILALLDELGPQGVTALAEADRSSQPTVSGAVRQLEEQGTVAKEADPTDAALWPPRAATTERPLPSGWRGPVTPPRTSPPRSPCCAT
jgi:hypothetical protein